MRSSAELDRALDRWAAAITRSRDAIATLTGDSRWDLLSGPLRQVFSGATARTLDAGCAAVERLRHDLPQLEAVIAKARAVQPRLMLAGRAVEEAFALLEGPSIVRAVADLPLERRGLLGPASTTTALTPDAVLARMEADFATASTAVATIYTAWSDAGETRKRLIAAIDALGMPEAAALRVEAMAAGEAALTDPLADHGQLLDQVAARLDDLRRRAADAAEQVLETRRRLERAAARLTALRASIDAAADACRAAAAVCADTLPPVPAIDAADLSDWLARLTARLGAADPASILAGLEAWTRPVAAAEAGAEAARAAARSLLDRRDEARGRLMAARRKANAVAGFGTDPTLQALAEAAQALLIGGRAEVAAGEAALGRFERAVEQARSPLASR
jgi:cell division septum initiation protein DivIVA